ncbi:TatD family hydrolase [Microbacterium oxydans]|uniref:TatD family hydrolase n=1 Tax=Microbacterium oxydans TaxID=82380 RepID=UPI000F8FA095|nr:TatD family hydrolase [Microbacterium oxydans]AZS46057.1 Tat-linked quality control protein TatD [Microbacterium oxydans]
MSSLPSIDAHAHIRADLEPREVATLDGLVFAATRSLDEAAVAIQRNDERVIWGVGVHPGLAGAQRAYTPLRFAELLQQTPLVSEVGLDGSSRVPMSTQQATFRSLLDVIAGTPRLVSVHSYGATDEVLDGLEEHRLPGVVLHWWLGDEAATRRAVDLGCMFSLNSSARSMSYIRKLPMDRVLPETDHPFGDRKSREQARPGNVVDVEKRIARDQNEPLATVRLRTWRNLLTLAESTGTVDMFPRFARRQFLAL